MTWLTACSAWDVHAAVDVPGGWSGALVVNMMVEFDLERDTIIMRPVLSVDVTVLNSRDSKLVMDQIVKLLDGCDGVPNFMHSANGADCVEAYVDVDPWRSMRTVMTRVASTLREVDVNLEVQSRRLFEKRATCERFFKEAPHLLMLVRTMSLPPERSGGLLYGDTIPSCIFWESCHVEVIYELLRWRAARPEAFDATLAALSQVRAIRGSWEGGPR